MSRLPRLFESSLIDVSWCCAGVAVLQDTDLQAMHLRQAHRLARMADTGLLQVLLLEVLATADTIRGDMRRRPALRLLVVKGMSARNTP